MIFQERRHARKSYDGGVVATSAQVRYSFSAALVDALALPLAENGVEASIYDT